MNMHISPSFSAAAYAGIWGFIVGDALGVPYEFSSREAMAMSPSQRHDKLGYLRSTSRYLE